MAPRVADYRRLPGRGRTALGSTTLWIGDDHLLLVELRGFTETYRRFYFRDVGAILVRRTRRAAVWSALLGVPGLVFLGIAARAGPGWNVFWGCLAGLAFLALAANIVLGPSCKCALWTPLQTVDLRSLRRLRRARRVVDRLRPYLELEQGRLTGDEILERLRGTAGAVPASGAPGTPAPPAPPVVETPAARAAAAAATAGPGIALAGRSRPLRHDNGRVHEILAYVLLGSAVVAVVPILYFNILLNAALSLVFLGRIACIVAALARQNHSDLPREIRRFPWAAFAWDAVVMVTGFFYGAIIVFQMLDAGLLEPGAGPASPVTMIEFLRNKPGFKLIAFVSSVAFLTLGVWGLVLQRRLRPAGQPPWQTLPT